MAEVGFEPMSRQMPERDERLAITSAVLEDMALDLGIAAGVGVLVAEATMDLGGGMPLLGRGVLVVGEDAIDERRDWPEQGQRSPLVQTAWGSAWLMTCRTVLRVCPNSREICRMYMPSRRAHFESHLVVRNERPRPPWGESIPVGTFTLTKVATVGFS